MSYVIQNFSKKQQSIAITPRFKVILSLKWINLFLFFFKLNKFSRPTQHLGSFIKFFFAKGLLNFFFKLLINVSANYMNKLTNLSVYWNFKILNDFLDSNAICKQSKKLSKFWFYNSYLLAIKIINFKVAKTFFKKFFFFIILFFSDYWYQFHTNLNFNLIFFFTKNNLKIYKFYSGYFLRVYNF